MKAEGPEEEDGRGEGRGGQKSLAFRKLSSEGRKKQARERTSNIRIGVLQCHRSSKNIMGRNCLVQYRIISIAFFLEGKTKPRLLLPISSSLPSVSA